MQVLEVCTTMPENLAYFDEVMKAEEIPMDTEGMKRYYQTFLALSANYHIAHEDWDQGVVCNSHADTQYKAEAFRK